MPVNETTFAYDELMADFRQRAMEAGYGDIYPTSNDQIHLLDISLDNPFDSPSDNGKEVAFWNDTTHAVLGEYLNWPLGKAFCISAVSDVIVHR